MSDREKKAKRRRERLKRRKKRRGFPGLSVPHRQRMPEELESGLIAAVGDLLSQADLSPPKELQRFFDDARVVPHPLGGLVYQLFVFLHRGGGWSFTPAELLLMEEPFVRHRAEESFAKLLALSLANVPELMSGGMHAARWPFARKADDAPLPRRALLYVREYPDALSPLKLFLAQRCPLPQKPARETAAVMSRMIFFGAPFAPPKAFEQGLARALALADLSGQQGMAVLEALDSGARRLPGDDDRPWMRPVQAFFRALFDRLGFPEASRAELFRDRPFLASRLLGISPECLGESDIAEFFRRHGRMMPRLALRILKTRFDPESMGFADRVRYEATAVKLLEMMNFEEEAMFLDPGKTGVDLVRELTGRLSAMAGLFEKAGEPRIEARFIAFFVRRVFAFCLFDEALPVVLSLLLRRPEDFRLRLLSIMGTWAKHHGRAKRCVDHQLPEELSHIDPVLFADGAMIFWEDAAFLAACRDLLYRRMGADHRTEFLRVLLRGAVDHRVSARVLRGIMEVFGREAEMSGLRGDAGGKDLVALVDRRLGGRKKAGGVRRKAPARAARTSDAGRQGVLF